MWQKCDGRLVVQAVLDLRSSRFLSPSAILFLFRSKGTLAAATAAAAAAAAAAAPD